MKPTDLELAPLESDLSRFEEILDKNVHSEHDFLNDVSRYVVMAGGKRLRPALAIASAYAITSIEPTTDGVLRGACAVELVHAGSLYHDDVIDNATSRRGLPSVNVQYSNTVAILSGDYLLSIASTLAASLGTEISALLAETIAQLTVGQIIEQQNLFDTNKTIDQYLSAIDGKTASLFSSSCKIGALVAGATEAQAEALSQFGFNVGMAFQIIDDLLDLTSDDETLGKPAGNDILEGVYTPAVIYAIENGSLDKSLLEPESIDSNRQQILDIVRETEFVAKSLELAKSYSEKAAAVLADAEINVEVKQSFEKIISGLLERTH